MGDSVIPNAPMISRRQRLGMVDDVVNNAQRGTPVVPQQPVHLNTLIQQHKNATAQPQQPAQGAVHPGVLASIQKGIDSLFGITTTQVQPGQSPAGMADGGVVSPGRSDSDRGSTGATYEPRLARERGGVMPQWKGNGPTRAAGDGGALAAPGDALHPPGDSRGQEQILSMAHGGSVSDYMPRSNVGVGDPSAFISDIRGAKQYNREEASRTAEADAIPTFAQQPEKELHDAVTDFGNHLEQGALSDAGTPAGAQAIPAPAAPLGAPPAPQDPGAAGAGPQGAAGAPAVAPGPATGGEPATPGDQAAVAAVATAANDPNAKAGIPQQSQQQSAKPHSLTHDWWDESNDKMMKAVQAATRAGKDPKQTMEAMVAVRNGFFQANIMKNLSAANVALLNGDNEAVGKALKNVYYYFPDGKELDIHKGPNGEVMYQDPIHPYIDQAGNPTDVAKFHDQQNKPNMVPVTPEHLQMIAQGAMDPLKVGDIIANRRAAGAKMALEAAEAHAKILTAQGEADRGRGILLGGQARVGELPSKNVKNLSDAELAQARAVTSGWALSRLQALVKGQKLDPTVLRGAQAAASAIDDMFLGNKTSVPVVDEKGAPSLSPAAGKVVHDPKSVQKAFQNATPIDVAYTKGLASSLYAANAKGGMQPAQAAEIASRFHMVKGKFHNGPSGSSDPDGWIHAEQGVAGLWNPATKKYDQFRIDPVTAQDLAAGPSTDDLVKIATSMGAGGQGVIPTGGENPVDQATQEAEQ